MTDHPMLFSPPMILALLREAKEPGTGKTQTRRALRLPTKTASGGPSPSANMMHEAPMTPDTKPLALRVADIIESRIAAAAGAVLPTVRLDIGAMTIDDATALAALLREAGGWNFDMDAAPRDGRRILLLSAKYGAGSGHFDETSGRFHLHFCLNKAENPIAWRPLPAPPAAGGKDG